MTQYRPNDDVEQHETTIITACALRFDGYAYADACGLDYSGATDAPEQQVAYLVKTFVANPDWSLPRNHLHMILFMLQRGLLKEGWLKWNSQEAKVMRLLFLELCRDDIPHRFRLEDWYETWNNDYKSILDECTSLVLQRHQATDYQET